MTSTSRDLALATADLGGAVVGEVLRASDKSLLALGQLRGLPGDQGAANRRRVLAGQVRPRNPAAPGLHPEPTAGAGAHTGAHRRASGAGDRTHSRPAGRRRALPRTAVPATTLDAVLDTITTFALWAPPCAGAGVRLPRPRRALPPRGVFDDNDRTALHALLEEAGPVWQANHGDPLPANLLLAERRVRAAGLRVHRAVPARL
jgi:hypothetical protein